MKLTGKKCRRTELVGIGCRLGWVLLAIFAVLWIRATAFGAVITVQSTADSGGICPGPSCTLRQAIADAIPSDIIDFSVTGTITLTSGELSINKDLTIEGPGKDQLAISGNNASRVFNISGGNTVIIIDLTVQQGNAGGNDGGGIYNEGDLTVENLLLSNNTARSGGGIYNSALLSATTTLQLTNSTFSGNTATNYGAGIANRGAAGGIVELWVTGSTFTGNTATNSGGAIGDLAQGGTTILEVTNSTFFDNEGTNSSGGGIYSSTLGGGTATVVLTNATLSDNSAVNGGGIYSSTLGGGTATAELKNTILANNTATGSGPDCWGTLTSLNYNLVEDTTGCGWTSIAEDLTGWDPNLGPLQDSGGPTQTMALLGGSPALNTIPQDTTGSPGGDTYNGCPDTDQRGLSRPSGAGDCPSVHCRDIGAYEDGATVVDLVYFRVAIALPDRVTLQWQTASETDNAGFHIWLSEKEAGDFVRITDKLIPAEGGPMWGADYAFEDTSVHPGRVYSYELEDLDNGGASTFHGPVKVEVPSATMAPWNVPEAEASMVQGGATHVSKGLNVLILLVAPVATVLFWFRRKR